MNIYCGNLPFNMEERELRDLFEKFGEVRQVNIPQDIHFAKNKGYGFIVMLKDEEGMKAVIELNGSLYTAYIQLLLFYVNYFFYPDFFNGACIIYSA